MQIGKDIALVALGATVVLACQKYRKPVMDKIGKTTVDVVKKADKKLDNMM